MKQLSFKVPCSTANFGCGFDSLGAALSLWLTVSACQDSRWIITTNSPDISLDYEKNLITQTAIRLTSIYSGNLLPLNITIQNEIPLGRGLGSSGAAIVAGLILGNYFGELNLSNSQILGILVF